MSAQTLEAAAQAMVADGKGILAIDESSPTIKKKSDSTPLKPSARKKTGALIASCSLPALDLKNSSPE
jgi:fructose-bisphosphate aldolase class 1